MKKSDSYIRAVHNLETILPGVREKVGVTEYATLKYDIFLLKMQPQFTGISKKEKTDDC